MLRDLLAQEGIKVGRKHVATLMKRMGIEALYRKPKTTKKHPQHRVYPYLLRGLVIDRPNQGLGDGSDIYPDGTWLCVPGGGAGLVLAQGFVVADIYHHGCAFLSRGAGRGDCSPRFA